MEKNKIKLLLHHDYFQIEQNGKTIQLPVRTAKLIKDMYNLRNAENETKDLLHYSNEGHENPTYELSVFVMNAKHNSELQWINKTIKPFTKEELKR